MYSGVDGAGSEGHRAPGRQTGNARADARGKWLVKIGPYKAGGPYTLTVNGPQTVTLQNVLFGDVWICSGQSEYGDRLLTRRAFPCCRALCLGRQPGVQSL